MHFLNGGRTYIQPKNGNAPFENQLNNCINQLKELNSEKRIYKLNFFAGTESPDNYNELNKLLNKEVNEQFETAVMCALISQAPLTCSIVAEAFYFDDELWKHKHIEEENGSAILFKREDTKVLIGNAQSYASVGCRKNSETVFGAIERMLNRTEISFGSIIRQWNYIEDITGFDEGRQRYQEFNNVRSSFYADHFAETGFPAATGIGTVHGGVTIEFVATDAPGAHNIPLNNPGQIAAHCYSEKVLVGNNSEIKTTPKFERARFLEIFDRKQVFISGTASIKGEKTEGTGDPEKQTAITIKNIQQLYSDKVLANISDNSFKPVYGHARVYIKYKNDFQAVEKVFKQYYGNLPVVYIIADICREDLLVEIEGKVILE